MSNAATVEAPVATDRQLTTHSFRGGPFSFFDVRFPRRSVLDDPGVNFIVFPRGASLEAALAWNDVSGVELDPGPQPHCAVYRRHNNGTWHHVPLSESLGPTKGRRCR
jgi:hypothetical protein